MPTSIWNPFFQAKTRKAPATSSNPNPNSKLCRIDFNSQISKPIPFRSDTAKQTQFPPDFIEEILLRLGVKSLVRFKCVSKQWFFLFSDPHFINRHLKARACTRTRLDFIVRGPKLTDFAIATLYDNANEILLQPLETNFKAQPSELILKVIGYCKGLVCLHFYSRETDLSTVLIWNPSTKEQKRFPMPECRHVNRGNREFFGFGYHSASDDYKVVLVTIATDKPVKVQSLSLKTGSWKTGQCNIPYSFTLDIYPKHVNDCIYWRIGHGKWLCSGVASFDFGTEILREEESLSWAPSNFDSFYINLELLGESLCRVNSKDQITFDVWLMKEDEMTQTKSWIKFFTFSSTDDNFTKPLKVKEDRIVPLCFTRNGKVLIYSVEREEYTLYDPNDQSIYKLEALGIPDSEPVTPYVDSLVSPGS